MYKVEFVDEFTGEVFSSKFDDVVFAHAFCRAIDESTSFILTANSDTEKIEHDYTLFLLSSINR